MSAQEWKFRRKSLGGGSSAELNCHGHRVVCAIDLPVILGTAGLASNDYGQDNASKFHSNAFNADVIQGLGSLTK